MQANSKVSFLYSQYLQNLVRLSVSVINIRVLIGKYICSNYKFNIIKCTVMIKKNDIECILRRFYFS